MLRSNEKAVAYLQKGIDFFISISLWCFVYYIRFEHFSDAQEGLWNEFLRAGIVMASATVFIFYRKGLYRSFRLRPLYDEVVASLKANCLANLVVVAFLYLVFDDRLSRAVLVGYFFASSVTYVLFRVFLRHLLRRLRRDGKNMRHVLLIGNGAAIERYVRNVKSYSEAGIGFKGWVDSGGLAEKYSIKSLTFSEIEDNERLRPDSFVCGYEGDEVSKLDGILRKIYNDVVPIIVLPDLKYAVVGHDIDSIAGVPAFVLNEPKFSFFDIFAKRIFDILASGVGLLLLSPLLFVLGILVKVSSPGPVFYGQERIGLDGHRFRMWKFRSMRMDTASGGGSSIPGWTVKNDPRRTKIGTFIRGTSIDELPQLWNVFIGDMSLVGPRPEQPFFVEKFKNEIPAYMLRHKMKAGITGWAQVNGWRGDTSLHKRIECDLYYIRNWSLLLDMEILLRTVLVVYGDKNAY
ncbi:undecaprenyl-phosphate glucose phosphotransferase [Bdellovibrio bacteriovorus]|uniref:undecaprenyl-phosphate glucose phosphotransferase n=1 Tax=Bdellovibrio bacteriovorus TaxID=959 RepID=UPI0035A57161